MVKKEIIYFCSHCDAQYLKWQGQCDECGKWGTVGEINGSGEVGGEIVELKTLNDIERITTKINEIDNVLGGGIVPGSLILIAGDPGIGKSTLVLQMINGFNQNNILYVCGEESAQQIGMRINRLGVDGKNIQFLQETRISHIVGTVKSKKPSLVIVDSIQTIIDEQIQSEAGNVSQIRSSTGQLLKLAKETNIPILIVGHVTKEGTAAGPQTLAHMVDVVLYLEGDKMHEHRLLRGVKNRFGATNQVGVFKMEENGLQEVKNPSELFLGDHKEKIPGSVVSVIMEGTRPFLIEIQALTNKTSYGYPKRATSGFDLSRLELLIAVLSRRGGLKLDNQDVFLNIVGGLRTKDPALDLAACLAIASSLSNQPLPQKGVVLGEVGLGGEVRPVSGIDTRVNESIRLGFENIYIPSKKDAKKSTHIVVNDINSALTLLGIQK
jgi:DNA repair protein RadA/Sms